MNIGTTMNPNQQTYNDALESAIQNVPTEYMPALIKIIDAFSETVSQKDFETSLSRSFQDAQSDKTYPIESLWED